MPLLAEGTIERATDDETLRNGLKEMFIKIHTGVSMGASMSFDNFVEWEDHLVDAFIGGLRTNGYDITVLNDAPEA